MKQPSKEKLEQYTSATQPQAKDNFERFKREYQAECPQVVKDWERELDDLLTLILKQSRNVNIR